MIDAMLRLSVSSLSSCCIGACCMHNFVPVHWIRSSSSAHLCGVQRTSL